LIEAATDRHLWADNFDREMRDILALHSEVARAITREIEIVVTPEEEAHLANLRPVNPEAYQRYLQGRYLLHQGSRESIEEGIKYFEEGIAIDPNDALSYAGLADAYRGLSSFYLPPLEVMPKAKAAALKALELDPTLWEARATLAYIKLNFEWDILGAEEELKRALEINPNSADAHSFYGVVLTSLGRHDEATAELDRALEIDPLSLWAHTYALVGNFMARRYDKTIESCEVVLRQVPTFPWAHAFQGLAYAQMGQFPEAIAAAEAATRAADTLFMQSIRAQVYAVTGKTREARDLLVEIEERARRQYVCPYEVGLAYVGLGEIDEAFNWLERAYLARADCMIWLRVDARLDPIRDDPRFQDLLSRIKFPD
jgi:tetratricopeptide (TPR) repeat protein